MPVSPPRSRILTTRSVPAEESLAFWHDAVFDELVGMDIQTGGHSYDAALRSDHLGAVHITTVDCDPGEVRRTPHQIARGDGEQVLVAVQATGRAQVEQDGRDTELHAGDLGFFETIRPFRTRFPERFQMKIFAVPRTLLCQQEGDLQRLTARALRPDHGLVGLVSTYLAGLADTAAEHGPALAERLARGAVDLLAATAALHLGQRPADQPGADRVLLLRVQRFIRWHLSDPGLTPRVIAHAHGISVRYLHRLFEHEGSTVCRWIRQQRLAECRADLLAADRVDIARVARRWGFDGGAQLGRAFRAAYGLSPTDWVRRERDERQLCLAS